MMQQTYYESKKINGHYCTPPQVPKPRRWAHNSMWCQQGRVRSSTTTEWTTCSSYHLCLNSWYSTLRRSFLLWNLIHRECKPLLRRCKDMHPGDSKESFPTSQRLTPALLTIEDLACTSPNTEPSVLSFKQEHSGRPSDSECFEFHQFLRRTTMKFWNKPEKSYDHLRK